LNAMSLLKNYCWNVSCYYASLIQKTNCYCENCSNERSLNGLMNYGNSIPNYWKKNGSYCCENYCCASCLQSYLSYCVSWTLKMNCCYASYWNDYCSNVKSLNASLIPKNLTSYESLMNGTNSQSCLRMSENWIQNCWSC